MKLRKLFYPNKKRDGTKIARSRLKYGVSIPDTFNLDNYLSTVMGNSLMLLADNLHGAPAGYPSEKGGENTDFKAWEDDLRHHASVFLRYANKDDEVDAIHDSLDWPKERSDPWEPLERGGALYVGYDESTPYGKAFKQYCKLTEKLEKEIDKDLKKSLKWYATWFRAFWD